VCGGFSAEGPLASCEHYSMQFDRWNDFKYSLPFQGFGMQLVSLNNIVYCIGGAYMNSSEVVSEMFVCIFICFYFSFPDLCSMKLLAGTKLPMCL
jgi:hypothetical protein